MDTKIYKVVTAEQWAEAQAGAPVRAPVDVADGYVHFSTAAQLQETLDKWFRGLDGCVLVEFSADDFSADLKWEPSRGGQLFPHVYGLVSARLAAAVWSLELGPEGAPLAPAEVVGDRSGGDVS
ncbi:MAG: DUF952 domain-containing protein [Hyphomonadaceae bacterium]